MPVYGAACVFRRKGRRQQSRFARISAIIGNFSQILYKLGVFSGGMMCYNMLKYAGIRACLKNIKAPAGGTVFAVFCQVSLKSRQDSGEMIALSGETIPHHLAECLFFKQGLALFYIGHPFGDR